MAFLPLTAGIIVGAAISQQLIRRLGVKPVLLGGLVMAASGLLWMTGLSPSSTYAGGMLPGLVLIALGMGNTFVPLTLTATTNVENDDQGLASGIFNTAQQIGGALGLAILSTVAGNATSSQLSGVNGPTTPAQQADAAVHGFTTAFTVGAGFMLGGVLLIALWLRRSDVAHISVEEGAMVPA